MIITKKITEQKTATKISEDADLLITQADGISGNEERSLYRASVALVVQLLKDAGINKGYVSEEKMREMYPDLVKSVKPTDNGILVRYFDGAEQEIPIESGGTGSSIESIEIEGVGVDDSDDGGSGGTGSGIVSVEIEKVGVDDSDDSGSTAGKDGVGITNITITEE